MLSSKKCNQNVNINGYVTDTGIANAFAAHFKNVFHSSHDDKAMMSSYVNVMNVLKLNLSRVMDMLIRYLLNLFTIVSRN